MNIQGGWSKSPHFIHEAMRLMSGAEYKCTAVLVRETYGYHRRRVRLTYGDFMQQTGIKGKATISAALKAIEARGFFRRGRSPSEWLVCEPPAVGKQAGGQENGVDNGWSGSDSPVMGSSNVAGHSMAGANGGVDGSISALELAVAELNRSIVELRQDNAELNRTNAEQNRLLTELIRSTADNSAINEPSGRVNGSIPGPKCAVDAKNEPGHGSEIEPRNDSKGSECEPLQYSKEKRSPSGKEREGGGSKPLPRPRARTQPADQTVRTKNLEDRPPKGNLPDRLERPEPHPKFPSPRSAGERDLAAHPAVEVWLDAGLAWPGWERLEGITGRLGDTPQVEALKKAREMWLMAGYRMGNIGGILDWYDALCRDAEWQPFVRTRGQAGRAAAGKIGPRDETMSMLWHMREELIDEQGTENGGLLNNAEIGLPADGFWRGVSHGLPIGAGGY